MRSGLQQSNGLDALFKYFWYFWLTIQNTANRQMRNLFYLLAVFISFPLARAAAAVAAADLCCCCSAPPPHPTPLFGGEGSIKKKIACTVRLLKAKSLGFL
jgi:hypothetical protein